MSHIDKEKLNRLEKGQCFEYRDIVCDDFPSSKHSQDGAEFKDEVVNGKFENIKISDSTSEKITYKKTN